MNKQTYFVSYRPVDRFTQKIEPSSLSIGSYFQAEAFLTQDQAERRATEYLKDFLGSYLAFSIDYVGKQTRACWG